MQNEQFSRFSSLSIVQQFRRIFRLDRSQRLLRAVVAFTSMAHLSKDSIFLKIGEFLLSMDDHKYKRSCRQWTRALRSHFLKSNAFWLAILLFTAFISFKMGVRSGQFEILSLHSSMESNSVDVDNFVDFRDGSVEDFIDNESSPEEVDGDLIFQHQAIPLVPYATTVIMGVAEGSARDPRGYGLEGLLRFGQTLYHTGFDGFMIIATDLPESGPEMETLAKVFNEKKAYFLNVNLFRVGRFVDLTAKELRYYMYRYWASQFLNEDTKIIITDVRDALFQENPFDSVYWEDSPPETNLWLFQESPIMNLGNSSFNSQWLSTCFGGDFLGQVRNELVLCSGTSAGSPSAIVKYATGMINEMSSPERLQKCHRPIHDQAFHNYLYYNGNLSKYGLNIHVFEQGKGPANNIGKKPVYDFFSENFYVLNQDGVNSALVHQYDRHADILVRMKKFARNIAKLYAQ